MFHTLRKVVKKYTAPIFASGLMLFSALWLNCRAETLADKGSMEYRYWDWGGTPRRDDYQFALLTLALDKTLDDYGPYKATRVVQSYSTSRLRREINRGDVVNLHVGPWRPLELSEDKLPERSLRINIPIFNDLMGYRQLLIRREDLDTFKNIKTDADLKKLTVGQARGWVDVDIYKYNGYPVDDSPNPSALFNMLAKKRFDYLPISLLEAESALAGRPDLADQLMLVPDLAIYFPLPLIFYVNIHEPKLAERLEKGLSMAKKDGSFDRLFNQFFAAEVQGIRASKQRHFVLKNPYTPKEFSAEKPQRPAAVH